MTGAGDTMTCNHGMPSRKSCIDCMEEGPVDHPSSWHGADHTFSAAYDGECPSCGNSVEVGQRIRQWSYGPSYGSPERTAYCHADCGAPQRRTDGFGA